MKDDNPRPRPGGDSPNAFESGNGGTADRSRAEAAIEDVRQRARATRRLDAEDEIASPREGETLAKVQESKRESQLGTITGIHSLADRLLTIPDLSTALGEVLDAAIALFDADRGTLQIHDPEDNVLRYAALRGFDTSALDNIPPIDRDFHSTCAVALRTEQRVVASDLYADPQWADHAPTAESLGYRAAVSTPLKTRSDEFQGVMTVHFDRARTPTEEELRGADLLARLAAHVIERAHSEQALRESEERLAAELENAKALQTMSGLLITEAESGTLFERIVDTAMAIMHADFGSIQLMDQERGELRLVASRNFSAEAEAYWQRVSVTSGSALAHGEKVIIENVVTDELTRSSDNQPYWKSSGIVAIQSTPLTARDGTIVGMISTHWREHHVPDERELRLFDVLARQAADFIERTLTEKALRESERHAKTLLAELQHRVRNTLGVIRSIARRTAENSNSVEEMLAHFQGRLDAFSRVQAALTRSAEGTVRLASIIEDELLAHAAHGGEQVQIAGPDIVLDPRTAERLSLAIHELTTNAVKHGALINGDGLIRISWDRQRNGAGEELVLNWLESGVDLDGRKPAREGFGMELLLRSLPYDVGGRTSVDFTPTGLSFEFRMPLAHQTA